MLHERPASCKVRAALSPAIPAPTIAIRGIVLLLSRSLETYENKIVILFLLILKIDQGLTLDGGSHG
jgi:hypothetical protein